MRVRRANTVPAETWVTSAAAWRAAAASAARLVLSNRKSSGIVHNFRANPSALHRRIADDRRSRTQRFFCETASQKGRRSPGVSRCQRHRNVVDGHMLTYPLRGSFDGSR